MGCNFQKLEWDSEFFGFSVGRINEGIKSCDLREPFNQDFKLLYLTSNEPIPEIYLESEYYSIQLVDEKVPLKKILDRETDIHPKISFYNNNNAEKELVFMAQHAGGSTRFKLDPNISEDKYNQLFEMWIQRSVSKEIADHVLVFREDNKIVGFATIAIEDFGPYVSLLAVNPEFEGKGVSFALMRAIERTLRDLGYDEVHGATQLNNRKALVVYERYGLVRQDVKYIYHLWRKENNI